MSITGRSKDQSHRLNLKGHPIPGIIPFGSICLFAGPSRIGKTTLWAEWLARMRDGRTINERETAAGGDFAMIGLDRQWGVEYAERFKAVGFPDIKHYTIGDDRSFDLDRFFRKKEVPAITQECLDAVDTHTGDFITFDSFSPLLIEGNPNWPLPVRISFLKLRRLAAHRQITIACILHHGKQLNDPKQQYRRLIDRISGSGDFAAATDTQLTLLDAEQDEDFQRFEWVPGNAKPAQFKYKRLDSGLFVPDLEDTTPPPANDRKELLLAMIPDDDWLEQPSLVLHACARFHVKKTVVYDDLKSLEAEHRIAREHKLVRKCLVS